MDDVFVVNGNAFSKASASIYCDGEKFVGWTEASWSEKRERTKGYGSGRGQAPQARTSGQYKPDNVKMKGRLNSILSLQQDAAANDPAGGGSYGDTELEIVINFYEPVMGIVSYLLHRAVFASDAVNIVEGPDGTVGEVEFDIMGIDKMMDDGSIIHLYATEID